MENIYTSGKHLLQVQRIKYKYMAVPAVIVFGSFFTNFYVEKDALKYISLFGLLLYLAILFYFKINRSFEPDKGKSILSPITGSVISFDEQNKIVIIKKKFQQNIEIRNPSEDDEIVPIYKGKTNIFVRNSQLKGELIGVILGSGFCELKIPLGFVPKVSVGDIVHSGETIFSKEIIQLEEND
ncbi:MAG: hypothetical protein K8S23_04280 [Candidatus Cloacimonetes bacterium]|nr:hypothetical protein [Candidatus Cloacimonadota bacterium]